MMYVAWRILFTKIIFFILLDSVMMMLPPASKATVFMRKNLWQAIEEMKQEVQKALVFALNRIRAIPKRREGNKMKYWFLSCLH